jgi:hypothetical protein
VPHAASDRPPRGTRRRRAATATSRSSAAVSSRCPARWRGDADGNVVGATTSRPRPAGLHESADGAGRRGADLANVVKLTVFLTDIGDLATVRRVRNEFVDPASPPASTLVQVSALVDPALKIEVEALAVVPEA